MAKSLITRGMRVAKDATPELQLLQVKSLQKLIKILNKVGILQGYATYDKSCMPLVDLKNYYVQAGIIFQFFLNKAGSICYLETVCNEERQKELGKIGCEFEHLVLKVGDACALDGYTKVPHLIPRPVSFMSEPNEESVIQLYCLYGKKSNAGEIPKAHGDEL